MPKVERITSVTVTAAKAFDYAGTSYAKGEPVTMPPTHAAIHGRRGDVSLSPIIENRQMVTQVPALRGRARKRAYKTRQMVSKDSR